MNTFALLGEEKISLCSCGQIRNTVSCVQKNRALSVGQRGIRLDLQGLVMPEVAGE
jgi:hypothetical protein